MNLDTKNPINIMRDGTAWQYYKSGKAVDTKVDEYSPDWEESATRELRYGVGPDGLVFLSGVAVVVNPSLSIPSLITTIPLEYRPSSTINFPVVLLTASGATTAAVRLKSDDGNLLYLGNSVAPITLSASDQLVFDQVRYSPGSN